MYSLQSLAQGGTPDSTRLDDAPAVTLIKAIHAEGNCWDNAPTESFFNSLNGEEYLR